ncbi:hypothetical protein NM688_g3516 [Phlebia brevispora]|uniref:Uncharacterized protein n=1 Tax=Phlebia brevispora TaxID=194682 RepID=A0ACC1T5Q6_9APHY|nr:hypothetical protein NM688_g3516 [Phlebia brevispora]
MRDFEEQTNPDFDVRGWTGRRFSERYLTAVHRKGCEAPDLEGQGLGVRLKERGGRGREHGIDEELPSRQWAAVLPLTTKWRFMHARTVAHSKLSAMADPIDKIVMYNDPTYELDAEQWLLPAVRSFCQRFDGLTVEEGTKLGMELTLRVCAIREKFAGQRAGCRAREHNELLDRIIKAVFELSE